MKLMSSLSNVLTQVNDRKEIININNENYKFLQKSHGLFAYFATINHPGDKILTDSKIDSLKITKIDHYFNSMSKDLLEKFRIVKADYQNLNNYLNSNLLANGFKLNELICNELVKFNLIFNDILFSRFKKTGKCKFFKLRNKKLKANKNYKFLGSRSDSLDSTIFKFLVNEASNLVLNKMFNNSENDEDQEKKDDTSHKGKYILPFLGMI